jgi:hypothetical protein
MKTIKNGITRYHIGNFRYLVREFHLLRHCAFWARHLAACAFCARLSRISRAVRWKNAQSGAYMQFYANLA